MPGGVLQLPGPAPEARTITLPPLKIAPDDPRSPEQLFDDIVTPDAVVDALDKHEATQADVRANPARARELAAKVIPEVKKWFLKAVEVYKKWSKFNRWGFTHAVPVVAAGFGAAITVLALLLRVTSPVTTRVIGWTIKGVVPAMLLCDPKVKFDMHPWTPQEAESYAQIAMHMPLIRFRYKEEAGTPMHVGSIAPYFAKYGIGDGHAIPTVDFVTVLAAGIQQLNRRVLTLEGEVERLRQKDMPRFKG